MEGPEGEEALACAHGFGEGVSLRDVIEGEVELSADLGPRGEEFGVQGTGGERANFRGFGDGGHSGGRGVTSFAAGDEAQDQGGLIRRGCGVTITCAVDVIAGAPPSARHGCDGETPLLGFVWLCLALIGDGL